MKDKVGAIALFKRLSRQAETAQESLIKYLIDSHLVAGKLVGPDIGVRWNRVLFHLVKSYLRFLPWSDNYSFIQSQGYWIRFHKSRYEKDGTKRSLDCIRESADDLVCRQTPEGFWPHPLDEWAGRASTVEGNFGGLALFEAYSVTKKGEYLEAASKWVRYLVEKTGFQDCAAGFGLNYFSTVQGGLVPNVNTLSILLFSKASKINNEFPYDKYIHGIIRFLESVQLETGELPYAVGTHSGKERPHYQCYQYNAFQFLDLCEAMDLKGLPELEPLVVKAAAFIATGVGKKGQCYYACGKKVPNIVYHSAVMGAALAEASKRGYGDYLEDATRAYNFVLNRQRKDGSFPWSEKEYYFLKDKMNYPHNLVMILWHLWMHAEFERL